MTASAAGLKANYLRHAAGTAYRYRNLQVARLQAAAPRGVTGETARRIRGQVLPGLHSYRIVFEAPTDAARFTNDGTRAHVIRPRSKRALAFNWPKVGGRAVFARVNHPGFRGTHWWDRTLKERRQLLRAAMQGRP